MNHRFIFRSFPGVSTQEQRDPAIPRRKSSREELAQDNKKYWLCFVLFLKENSLNCVN